MLACTKLIGIEASSKNQFSVRLEEEFQLIKGQWVKLTGTGLEAEILDFFNQPCPPNVMCPWSGMGIEFEYRYDGQSKRGINLVKAFGYQVTILKSDYKSYAILRITQDTGQ